MNPGGRAPTAGEADLRALSLGYAAAVDSLDGAAFAELFTPDGEIRVPDPRAGGAPTIRRVGRDQLTRIPSGLARYRATAHAVWATVFDVRDGTATGTVDGVAHHVAADATSDGAFVDEVWYLRYDDRYVRTAGGWRIARRDLHLDRIERRPLRRPGPERT